jgi:hypothetical protein
MGKFYLFLHQPHKLGMDQILSFVPEEARAQVQELLEKTKVSIKIKKKERLNTEIFEEWLMVMYLLQ